MFKNCLKKEILEELRTKRFLRFVLISLGMVILTLMIIGVMSLVSKMDLSDSIKDDQMSALMPMFEPTFSNFSMYFGTFMMTYFNIVLIIMMMSVVSKEISQNKWVLPLSTGILPENIILAKLIVKTLSVVVAEILAIIVHFIFAITMFDAMPSFDILDLLTSYLGIILFTMFVSVLTISINAVFKKGWVSAAISLTILIMGSTILEAIAVGGGTLICYTPLAFYEIAINPMVKLTTTHWLVSMGTWIVSLVLLVLLAISKCKIKPQKLK